MYSRNGGLFMLIHYVEFSFAGAIFCECSVEKIAERKAELVKLPEGAFRYQFFDREEIEVDGEKIFGKRKNESAFTYFGKKYTLEEVKKMFPQEELLIRQMERKGWNQVVQTCIGNWKPLEKGDIVITNDL